MAGFEIFTTEIPESVNQLEVFKEYAIDFTTGEPILKNGEFIILEKNEALKVWVWKALKTQRNRYKAYSDSFGNDLENNIGEIYSPDITNALIETETKECLGVNPYIQSVYDFEFGNNGNWREPIINFKIDTIYESEVINWTI